MAAFVKQIAATLVDIRRNLRMVPPVAVFEIIGSRAGAPAALVDTG